MRITVEPNLVSLFKKRLEDTITAYQKKRKSYAISDDRIREISAIKGKISETQSAIMLKKDIEQIVFAMNKKRNLNGLLGHSLLKRRLKKILRAKEFSDTNLLDAQHGLLIKENEELKRSQRSQSLDVSARIEEFAQQQIETIISKQFSGVAGCENITNLGALVGLIREQKESISALAIQVGLLDGDKEALNDKCDYLSNQLEEIQIKYSDILGRNQELQEEVKEQAAKIVDLKAENEKLKALLAKGKKSSSHGSWRRFGL